MDHFILVTKNQREFSKGQMISVRGGLKEPKQASHITFMLNNREAFWVSNQVVTFKHNPYSFVANLFLHQWANLVPPEFAHLRLWVYLVNRDRQYTLTSNNHNQFVFVNEQNVSAVAINVETSDGGCTVEEWSVGYMKEDMVLEVVNKTVERILVFLALRRCNSVLNKQVKSKGGYL